MISYRVIALLAITAAMSSCVVMSARSVPYASFEMAVASDDDLDRLFQLVESTVAALGYLKLPNQFEAFGKLPNDAWLARRLQEEHNYGDGRFKLTLSPEHERPALWIQFYEYDKEQFTTEGMARFAQLQGRIRSAHVVISPPTDKSDRSARASRTPQQFNAEHPPRTSAERWAGYIPSGVTLLIYAMLILLPGLLLLRMAVVRLPWKPIQQRLVLSLSASFLLAPMPLPVSIVGPALFVPNILFLPTMGVLSLRLWPWLVGSVAVTALLSFVFSVRAIRFEN